MKNSSMLKFHVNGSSPIDARNQDVATVDLLRWITPKVSSDHPWWLSLKVLQVPVLEKT